MNLTTEQILDKLLDKLWLQYIQRVGYARTYVDLVTQKKGDVVNDHIALRTLNTKTGKQPAGIEAFSFILKALGYEERGMYKFPNKKLNATHFQHSNPKFPKIFVSQLEVDQLPEGIQSIINAAVQGAPNLLGKYDFSLLNELHEQKELDETAAHHLINALRLYFKRPWLPPYKRVVETVNQYSPYGAWTLLHGNSVNHFTAFINYQNVEEWDNIDKTVEALIEAGVPMKENVEGEAGSILRQSSTEAVTETCIVRSEAGELDSIEWTYAYYELAERGIDPETNQLFQGFLGEQATHLFDMTDNKE